MLDEVPLIVSQPIPVLQWRRKGEHGRVSACVRAGAQQSNRRQLELASDDDAGGLPIDVTKEATMLEAGPPMNPNRTKQSFQRLRRSMPAVRPVLTAVRANNRRQQGAPRQHNICHQSSAKERQVYELTFMSCARSNSSAVQKDASAFLYICQTCMGVKRGAQ